MTSFELSRLSHLRDLILVQFLVLLEGKLCTVVLGFLTYSLPSSYISLIQPLDNHVVEMAVKRQKNVKFSIYLIYAHSVLLKLLVAVKLSLKSLKNSFFDREFAPL